MEHELNKVAKYTEKMLNYLPENVSPLNLELLRRAKQGLVEL